MHPSAKSTCSACGSTFTTQAVLNDGRSFRYWCPKCDAHAVGCQNRNHRPGHCIYPKEH